MYVSQHCCLSTGNITYSCHARGPSPGPLHKSLPCHHHTAQHQADTAAPHKLRDRHQRCMPC